MADPEPGGVGPMTRAMLIKNTFEAEVRRPPVAWQSERVTDTRESLAYISKLGRFGMKLGTERTRAILDHLGNPERGLRGALIAGTNGKGSTAACLASILQAAGHNVGFMPKPHLISYTERIQVNGVPISEQRLRRRRSKS